MTPGLPIQVLLIDDDEEDYLILRDLLSQVEGRKFIVDWVPTSENGKKALVQEAHDVCLLDYRLGGRTGLDLLKEAIADRCKTPIILLTGYGEQEVDFEAMRIGAADYLVKDQVSPLLLERSIRYSIHRAQATKAIFDREAQILVQDRLASVGLLASSLAHEIGTPLGVIRGRAEYLGIQVGKDSEILKNVEVIISQIDRVSKLIHSLLNLARGDQMKNAKEVHLNEIVAEVVDLMGHELRKHGIETQNELTQKISVAVKAESAPLHQVLLNLLVNSVQAIETAVREGRVSGHFIKISVQDRDSRWALKIEDSGCGISEKNMKNLFKPFFTTKDIGVGTGLGLATSYRIIESWGGSILARSTEGKGTEFQILLPKALG